MTFLKLLIADSHPMYLRGIRSTLQDVPGYEIAHETASAADALQAIIEHRPGIALLDAAMPGMPGFAILRQIQNEAPETSVVLLSGYEEASFIRDALAAGVRGYLLKRSDPSCLVQALNAVRDGGLYLDPAIASHVVAEKMANRRGTGSRRSMPLTEREREVFRLIALGFTNKEIAGKLGVTAKSIETYKNRASEKLDIRSRAKIVEYAMLQGWFNMPPV